MKLRPAYTKEQFQIAKGTRNLGKAKNVGATWAGLCKRLGEPTKTQEKFAQYLEYPKERQDQLKNVEGWWIGAHCIDGRRGNKSITERRIITFDMDDCPSTILDDLTMGLTGISGYEFVTHSTRKHMNSRPRLRIVFLLKETIPVEMYNAACRVLAQKLDPTMNMVDDVSFRPAQMMFWPSHSINSDWFYFHNDGELLDAREMLDAWGDWRDFTKLPFSETQGQKRPSAEKAENPREKKGIIGAFCRAYSVEDAITAFIPDVYAPGDEDSSTKPRYTYLPGSATNGVVVEDDGDFIYSHHSSDPCGDRLVNAFDMVRIHKFESLDAKAEESTSPGKLPSFKAMVEMLEDDKRVIQEMANERYDMVAMFEDSDLDPELEVESESQPDTATSGHPEDEFSEFDDILGPPTGPLDRFRPKPFKRAGKKWFSNDLEFDQNGALANSMNNAAQIITNDDRLTGCVAFDDFGKRIVLKRDFRSKIPVIPPLIVRDREHGDRWLDPYDVRIRALLEFPNGKKKPGYGMKITDRDLTAAIQLAADRNTFHPIRDWLVSLEGKPHKPGSVETMLIRYLGCPDTPYYREVAKVIMLASVTRVFEPGCKFDHAPVLQGAQGVRKSSFIAALYGHEVFGEITCKLNDVQEIAENIAGRWAMEFPELASFYKSDHNDAKAFLSRQKDDVRMAYDRRVSEFPRQTVFWGTTNDDKYLRDPTGNRRWWIVHVLTQLIDTDALASEREALWTEAVAMYVAARRRQPHGSLHLDLHDPDAQAEAVRLQEQARTLDVADQWQIAIQDWLDEPLRLSTLKAQYLPTKDSDTIAHDRVQTMGDLLEGDDDEIWVKRCAFRQEDVLVHVLNKAEVVTTSVDAQTLERALSRIHGWGTERQVRGVASSTRKFGIKTRWRVRKDVTEEEAKTGYRIVPAPRVSDDDDGDDYGGLL